MKRILITLFTLTTLYGFSQHFERIYIENLEDNSIVSYCVDEDFMGIILYGIPNCENNSWYLINNGHGIIEENVDSIFIEAPYYDLSLEEYYGCGFSKQWISFKGYEIHQIENPFADSTIFKRFNDFISLNANPNQIYYYQYQYVWSTGENNEEIIVREPGVYYVTISNPCNSATYSVEVRDNVELYRATVDLRTNKNKVTWLATPEQAEYITEVKVYRDGNLVGTVPYANGYFLDAIGSDAAARTYQIVGVSVEGEDCPIASYQKGTIHTTYYLDVNNDLNMTWNAPYIQEEAEGQLTGYQIYKYNPATEELTLIDEVNTTITNYTCSANAFFGGRATVAAVFSSKGDGQTRDEIEERAFSNLTENTFTVVEQNGVIDFNVYPNPTNGEFTVQGVKDLTVFNTLGQTIATSHSENGTHQITVSSGIYFIKSDEGVIRKVVVEWPI